MNRQYILRLVRQGWVVYPLPLDEVGNFVEDLPLIVALVHSHCYELVIEDRQVWIRRLED